MRVHDSQTAEMSDLLPEAALIADGDLRDAVLRIWAQAWRSSVWDDPATVPKSPELPGRRTLLAHTRSVTRVAVDMARALSDAHDLEISCDKVAAVALLHDVSKLREFEPDGEGGARHSEEGRLLQHGFLGAHWMEQEGLAPDLVHAVVAHTPLSAVVPQTHEAVIVHYADFVDSDVLLLDAGLPLFCKRARP